MPSRWGPEETLFLQHMVGRGKTATEMTEAFAESTYERTKKSIVRKIAQKRKSEPGEWRYKIQGPPRQYRRYDEQIKVESDRVLAVFDAHAPLHLAKFLNAVIGLALKERCDTVVIGGDLIEFDVFSPFGRQAHTQAEEEIRAAEQVVTALADAFETVVYFNGNHEQRAARKLEGLLPVTRVMEWFVSRPNVQLSEYRWCELLNGGEKWQLEHPANSSYIPTRVAQGLCSKYLCHVIMGHNHLWGMTKDMSGTFYAIESGVCADPQRFEYTNMKHSKRPAMCVGAVMILDGRPVLLDERAVGLR